MQKQAILLKCKKKVPAGLKATSWKNDVPGVIAIFLLACMDIFSPWLVALPSFTYGIAKYFQLILGGWIALAIRNQIVSTTARDTRQN